MKQRESIIHEGIRYYYEHRLGKNGEICLATLNPKEYCNGIYTYSQKDPGDGMAFVVIEHEEVGESSEGIPDSGTSGYFMQSQIKYDGEPLNY